jgi:hypothetical protein
MKTIEQIKDCQAIDLGYNSFRDLVLNPKKDMSLMHLNWCIERSMKEYAGQEVNLMLETISKK